MSDDEYVSPVDDSFSYKNDFFNLEQQQQAKVNELNDLLKKEFSFLLFKLSTIKELNNKKATENITLEKLKTRIDTFGEELEKVMGELETFMKTFEKIDSQATNLQDSIEQSSIDLEYEFSLITNQDIDETEKEQEIISVINRKFIHDQLKNRMNELNDQYEKDLKDLIEKIRKSMFHSHVLDFFAFVIHPENRKSNTLIDYFNDPAGTTFEKFCCSIFEAQGFTVEHRGGSGDFGIDIVLEKETKKIYCQCKNGYALHTDFNSVFLKLIGIMAIDEITDAFLITSTPTMSKNAPSIVQRAKKKFNVEIKFVHDLFPLLEKVSSMHFLKNFNGTKFLKSVIDCENYFK
jgi:HJR/Mrr/RecB family endonuclease